MKKNNLNLNYMIAFTLPVLASILFTNPVMSDEMIKQSSCVKSYMHFSSKRKDNNFYKTIIDDFKFLLSFTQDNIQYVLNYDQKNSSLSCMKDGVELWSHDLDYLIIHEPMIYDKKIYLQDQQGILYALDLESGQNLWATYIGKAYHAQLVSKSAPIFYIREDSVFIITVCGYYIHLVDADSGIVDFTIGPLEETPINAYGESLIAVDGDRIFVTQESVISCYSLTEKKFLWKQDVGFIIKIISVLGEQLLLNGDRGERAIFNIFTIK